MTTLNNIENSIAMRTSKVESSKEAAGRQVLATGGNKAPATQANPVQAEQKKKELQQALKNVEGYVQNVARELDFSVDEELDKFVVKVLDQKSGEVIRQIPSEEMLEIAKSLSSIQDAQVEDSFKGVLFQGKA